MTVSCAISNLSIEKNDEIVFIPMKLYGETFNYHTIIPISYEPNNQFKPFLFPIEGVYNGFLGIKDIVKNKNTEIIEKRFECSIEDFLDFITTVYMNNKVEKFYKNSSNELKAIVNNLVKDTTGIFILKSYYNEFISNNFNEKNELYQLILETSTSQEVIDKKNHLQEVVKEMIGNGEDLVNLSFITEFLYENLSRLNHSSEFILKKIMHYKTSQVYQNDIIYFSKEIILMNHLYEHFFFTNKLFYPTYEGNVDKKDFKVQIELEEKILEILERK